AGPGAPGGSHHHQRHHLRRARRRRRVRTARAAAREGSRGAGARVRDRHDRRRERDLMTGEGLVLETRGLRKTFESEGAPVRALRGVDFTMTPGEFVAVMGPSGCGKSTLLNLVADRKSTR